MKKLLLIVLLLLGMTATAWANLDGIVNSLGHSPTTVVVFMEKRIIADGKAVIQMRDVLKEKFKRADTIAIYGDDQPKSSEFLEFMEKIKTDPANEKDIKSINIGELAKYGRAVKSDYVILITVSPFNTSWNYWSGVRVDTKASVSVVDVNTLKFLQFINYYKEGTDPFSADGAQFLIKKLAAEFTWSPPNNTQGDVTVGNQPVDKKPAVVLFLPDVVLEKPDLVEKVRKTVSAKFRVNDVSIYIDDKQKSPQFLDLISRVETDTAKQQTFVLKKERLTEYGKSINANPITAIVISNVGDVDTDYNYRLKADIFVVDTEENKYLSNVVFDTVDKKKRQDGIDFLMNKLQLEFKTP